MAINLTETLIVAGGGAAGAVCRYIIQQSTLFPQKTTNTLIVNLAGCLAIGIIWALLSRFNAPVWINRITVAGFLGGFTTFSTFALDVVSMADASHWREALFYATLSVAGGIVMCLIGFKAAEAMLNP